MDNPQTETLTSNNWLKSNENLIIRSYVEYHQEGELTRKDFLEVLEKVSRPNQPQPDEEKSQTSE